ncbi:winged helix-turn-helix transcriptional regulator [Pseudonocardia pini]|uniref:winged helix-turn-helix transcriptional regulator n=1 Tax=Pseudonocardia pini TaxID=2758030 RepID=UPI0015F11CCB|nr:helix-turn-helix domain-containing protein [Pseudonocardia pini]
MATTTAAERRDADRASYDVFLVGCPSRLVLERISDRWVALLLAALSDGPKRYSELGRKVAGVSPKMLTQTLRALERDGLVEREVTPSVPVRVDYRLTSLGEGLHRAVLAVKDWAEAHVDEVLAARDRYDAESG